MTHRIVGEGTYGCVIKPALKCESNNAKINYDNKISKVMTKKDANDELKEMKFLSKLKGIEKYAISVPKKCSPNLDSNFDNIVKNCTGPYVSTYYKNRKNNLAQLLLEDGGLNLEQTIQLLFGTPLDKRFNNVKEHNLFFTSLLNLFDGLIFFRKNNVVHFDIKLINLVYNIETNEAKFIDFGIMQTDSKIIDTYSKSRSGFAIAHYNFPPENQFGNKNRFLQSDNNLCKLIRNYYYSIANRMQKPSPTVAYNFFLSKLVNTFDSWSLCYALIGVFCQAQFCANKRKDKKTQEFTEKVIELLNDYWAENITIRNDNLQALRDNYEKILRKYNIYAKNITKVSVSNVEMKKVINDIKEKNIDDPLLKQKCEKLNKDFNPISKRCNARCKKGYERNDEFKCVKIKEGKIFNENEDKINNIKNIKNINNKSLKKIITCLKENKDYNPKTKRCNARCKKGEIRNKDFKCVTIKNRQGRSLQLKSKSKNGSKSFKKNKSI